MKAPASVHSDQLYVSVTVFISGVHYKVGTAVFGQVEQFLTKLQCGDFR